MHSPPPQRGARLAGRQRVARARQVRQRHPQALGIQELECRQHLPQLPPRRHKHLQVSGRARGSGDGLSDSSGEATQQQALERCVGEGQVQERQLAPAAGCAVAATQALHRTCCAASQEGTAR